MRNRIFNPVLITSLICLVIGYSNASAQKRSPYEVKAAALYNFARFVEWPPGVFADTTSPVIIGILGDDPFDDILARTVKGKVVKGRALIIRQFKDVDDIEGCHILFISPSEKRHLGKIFSEVAEKYVLTVGETECFALQGGMIGFVIRNNKVRCEINVEATRRSALRISPKLLKVAEIVGDNPADEDRPHGPQ